MKKYDVYISDYGSIFDYVETITEDQKKTKIENYNYLNFKLFSCIDSAYPYQDRINGVMLFVRF